MRCDWILAKTQFEIVLGFFQSDAMGIGLGHNLELSWDIFNQMRLEFGSDTIWNCNRKFSMRCDWNFAKTQLGTVLEQCQ